MFWFKCYCCSRIFVLPDEMAGTVWSCPYTSQRVTIAVHGRMTETDWQDWTEPRALLSCLNLKASRRKRRLLRAAVCWQRGRATSDSRWRAAVEAVEQFADHEKDSWPARAALAGAYQDAEARGDRHRVQLLQFLAIAMLDDFRPLFDEASAAEKKAECDMIREIYGNLFWQAKVNPSWLPWNGGTVAALAQMIYDERTFEQMPILADALEEAGCDQPAILAHCRQSGEHVRGCWVVDLLLGKK